MNSISINNLTYICDLINIEDLHNFALVNKRIFNVCAKIFENKLQEKKKHLTDLIYESTMNQEKLVILNFDKPNGDKCEFECYEDFGLVMFRSDEIFDPNLKSVIFEFALQQDALTGLMRNKIGNKFHFHIEYALFTLTFKLKIKLLLDILFRFKYRYKSISIIQRPRKNQLCK